MCLPLDPERFLTAWHKAQEMADAKNVVPLATRRSLDMGDGTSLRLNNNEFVRWLVAVRNEFPDPNEAMSCSMRFFGITVLAEKGQLGVFQHPEHGIWTDALRVLAVAPCHVTRGYTLKDVRERLAQIPPPPSV